MLRKVLFLLVGLVFSMNVLAQSGTTNSGYFACLTEEWLDDIMSFAAANDVASGEAYRESNKCLILKSGLKVSITKRKFGKVQFAFEGVKFWTLTEAVTRQ